MMLSVAGRRRNTFIIYEKERNKWFRTLRKYLNKKLLRVLVILRAE